MENYTVRFYVRHATDSIRCRERVSYVGHISDRLVEELESNCSTRGLVLAFKINSTSSAFTLHPVSFTSGNGFPVADVPVRLLENNNLGVFTWFPELQWD